MIDNSLVAGIPLLYLLLIAILIGSVLGHDVKSAAFVSGWCLPSLWIPFGTCLWLESVLEGSFGSVSSASSESVSSAFATFLTSALSMTILGATFWWLAKMTRWLKYPSKAVSLWMCTFALVLLFGFGRFVNLHGTEVDSLWVDLTLGVAGTWLVTKVVLTWAVAEFWEALVHLSNVVILKAVTALLLAVALLFIIVQGLSAMSPPPDILPSGGVFKHEVTPWVIPVFFALPPVCYGLLLWKRFYSSPTWALRTILGAWLMGNWYLFFLLNQDDLALQLFPVWFAISCAGFAAEGYVANSTTVVATPRRKYTWHWSAFVFLSSGLSAYLALSTAGVGVALGLVTCFVFLVTQPLILTLVLRLDLATPSASDPVAREAERNGWFKRMAQGVIQDSVSAGLLAIVFGYVPLILYTQVGMSTSFLSFVVFYAGFVSIGLDFLVKADVDWLQQRSTLGYVYEETSGPTRGKALAGLRRHINFHVYWTLATLAPIALLQRIELSLEQSLNIHQFSTNVWSSVDKLRHPESHVGLDNDTDSLPLEEPDVAQPDAPESINSRQSVSPQVNRENRYPGTEKEPSAHASQPPE